MFPKYPTIVTIVTESAPRVRESVAQTDLNSAGMIVKTIREWVTLQDPYWNGALHCALIIIPLCAMVWRLASATRVANAVNTLKKEQQPLIPTSTDYKPGSSGIKGMLETLLHVEVIVVSVEEIQKLNNKIVTAANSIESKVATAAIVERLMKVEAILEQRINLFTSVLQNATQQLIMSKQDRLQKAKSSSKDDEKKDK